MKNIIITALICFIRVALPAQELYFDLRPAYDRSVNKAQLESARSLSDITSGFPSNWLNEYVSVEILSTCNGKVKKAQSLNDIFNAEQKNILLTTDVGADITIDVKYKSKNVVTEKWDIRNMLYSLTLIQENEAEFKGGKDMMNAYLKTNGIDKLPKSCRNDVPTVIKFFINEQGMAEDLELTVSCGNDEIDNQLMDVIRNMPKWTPASNKAGVKGKQRFVFSVGNGGC